MAYDDEREKLDIKKLKYVMYLRKSESDEGRQIFSIPQQREACKALAERLELNVVDEIEEHRSAKIPNNRPNYSAMIQRIKNGKYDAILAWNPDRLSRNMLEAGELIDMIDNHIIQDLKFSTHHFTDDANGKMLLGIAFVLSKQYSDKLSQDVTRGVRGRHKKGFAPTPKHGYIKDEHGFYVPDGTNFELIKEAWDMRIKGDSLETIAKYLSTHNYGRTKIIDKEPQHVILNMTKQKLSTMFRDPFYYGILLQRGHPVSLIDAYEGHDRKFEPAITKELYNAVQMMDIKKPYRGKSGNFYPFGKLVRCGYCDNHLYVGPSTGSSKTKYLNFRCDTPHCIINSKENKDKKRNDPTKIKASTRVNIFLDFVYDFLSDGLNFTQNDYEDYISGLKQLTDKQKDNLTIKKHSLEGRKKHISGEIKRISLNLGKFDKNSRAFKENQKELGELEAQEAETKLELQKIKDKLTQSEDDLPTMEEFLNLTKNADAIVKAGDPVVKDTICRMIFLNAKIKDGKILSYQLKEPFNTLAKTHSVQQCRSDWT